MCEKSYSKTKSVLGKIVLTVSCSILPWVSLAEGANEIVVTGTRLKEGNSFGLHATTKAMDSASNDGSVESSLKNEVSIDDTGASQSTLSFRGLGSEQTETYFEDIPLDDTSSPAGGFDFSVLPRHVFSSLQIVRGPDSVATSSAGLGGSVRLGFVSEDQQQVKVGVQAGRYSTAAAHGFINDVRGPVGYRISAGHFQKQGPSIANDPLSSELDATQSNAVAISARYRNDSLEIKQTSLVSHVIADIDNSGGPGGDDPNNTTRALLFANEIAFGMRHDDHLSSAFYTYTRYERNNINPSEDSAQSFAARYGSSRHTAQLEDAFSPLSKHWLRWGMHAEKQTAQSTAVMGLNTLETLTNLEQSSAAVFVEDDFDNKILRLVPGLRIDARSSANISFTARLKGSYKIAGGEFSFTAGNSSRQPSLYQMYSLYGDKTLKAEDGIAADLAFALPLSSTLSVTLSAFENRIHNLIDFDLATSRYRNIGMATTLGIETLLQWQPLRQLVLQANSTHQLANDATGRALPRRPQQKANFALAWKTPTLETGIRSKFSGQRFDDIPTGRVTLPGYSITELYAQLTFATQWTASVQVQNIFDKRYQVAWGYNTPRRTFLSSLQWRCW